MCSRTLWREASDTPNVEAIFMQRHQCMLEAVSVHVIICHQMLPAH